MKPSIYQEAIYDSYKNEGNILVNAVAGSGKTTTLIELMKQTTVPSHYLAFNSSIDKEIGAKISDLSTKHSTLHSLGFRSLMKHSGTKLELSNQKIWQVGKELDKKWKLGKNFVPTIMRLGGLIDVWRITLCKNSSDFIDQAMFMGLDFKIEDIVYLEDLVAGYEKYNKNPKLIDFVDMIHLPATQNIPILTDAKILFGDEVQDFSSFQHLFFDKIIKQNKAKWVSVGDPYQSIYLFAGANSKSFDMFQQKENVTNLPLSICYRCPDLIVDEANTVHNIVEKNDFKGLGELNRDGSISKIKHGDMVICRNTKPLVQLFFNLIGQGVDATIKGSDIGKGLIKMIMPYKHESISSMIRGVQKLLDQKEQVLKNMEYKNPKKHASYVEIQEKIEIVIFVSDRYKKVTEIIDLFKRIFTESNDFKGVTLSTIHKSKGLEASNIYFLNQKLIPSEYATTKEQLLQEQNLKYVAITRAEQSLTYLSI